MSNPYPTISTGGDTSGLKDTAREYIVAYARQPTITKAALGAGAGYLLTRFVAKKHAAVAVLIGGVLGALTKAE